jgi:hypothetical protein
MDSKAAKGNAVVDEAPKVAPEAPTVERELTGSDILNVSDVSVERVDVPEWGGHTYVRTLEAEQKEKYIESIRKITGKGKKQSVEVVLEKSSAKLAALTMCKKDGTLLYPNGSTDVIDRLAKKNAKALSRVVEVAARLNGLNDEAEEEAGKD